MVDLGIGSQEPSLRTRETGETSKDALYKQCFRFSFSNEPFIKDTGPVGLDTLCERTPSGKPNCANKSSYHSVVGHLGPDHR